MRKKGFTLVEMLIVVVIVGTLSSAIVPRIGNTRDIANDTARMADIKNIASALISYKSDHISYPDVSNASELATQLNSHYGMGGTIPTDPVSHEPYSYKPLNNGKHFVLCAKLSSSSDEGNSKRDYAYQLSSVSVKDDSIKKDDGSSKAKSTDQDDDLNGDNLQIDGRKFGKELNPGGKELNLDGKEIIGKIEKEKEAEKEIDNLTYEQIVRYLNDKGPYFCYAR